MSTGWNDLIPHIAHDIRALARKGMANAQLLEKHLGSDADQESASYLRAIIASQTDLNFFISRLLALAEAGSASAASVDLETAVLGARLELRNAIEAAGAEVVVRELPACSVPKRTQAVLKELIDNSLRYLHPARKLRIVIEAEADGGKIRVSVADNGTGIEPPYIGNLFQPLQRLDAARSGFGLGLAISRTIVESGGGSICAQPSEEGITVMLELPDQTQVTALSAS